jgi:hypothetical protein
MMKRLFISLFAIAFATSALSAPAGSGSPDIYFLNETNIPGGAQNNVLGSIPSRDVSGRTLASQAINTAIQNCVLIAAGQSNFANMAPDNFTPVNPTALFNLNIYDSAIYKAADPLIGASFVNNPPPAGGHPALRLADALVTAGKCAAVYIVPIAIDSSNIALWSVGGLAGRLPVAMARLKQRGITCGATNITCAMLWGQGESDNVLGTTAAAYESAFATIVANAAAAGFVGRWLVAEQTYDGTANPGNPTIQGAQAAVVNGTTIFAGPNADSLVGSVCGSPATSACRQSIDGIHFTDAGSLSYAALWQTALHASGAPF